MKDADLRGLVLREFYERRRQNFVHLQISDFGAAHLYEDLQRICRQLHETRMLDTWRPTSAGEGPTIGVGRISADGVDVMEGTKAPPPTISIDQRTIDQRTTISVASSRNVQIGTGNVQVAIEALQELVVAINNSSFSPREKEEAKGLLKRLLENPVVAAILGAAASSIFS
jgi:hypothetical protein